MEKFHLYIVLTRTNTLISRLIHFVKQDEYTHAAISLDKELNSMYSFGRRDTHNPFIGRFRKEDINEGVYKLCESLPGAIIELEVSKDQYEKAKKLLEHFIYNSELYKYNYRGLVDNLLKNEVYREDRFLCSEFVYHVLNKSGVINLEIPRNLVRPQDFLDVKGKMIFKGNLKEIKSSKNSWIHNEMISRRMNAIYE